MGKYRSIDAYIDAQPEAAARLLRELRTAILEAVPDAEETFNYGVPAFALVPGGKGPQQVMMGAFKAHVGLYPQPETLDYFAEELTVLRQGKGSLQFPLGEPLPRDLVIRMVRHLAGQLGK